MTPAGEDPWHDLSVDELNEKRIQAREKEEAEQLCAECNQPRKLHARVRAEPPSGFLNWTPVIHLICPRSTFTPQR